MQCRRNITALNHLSKARAVYLAPLSAGLNSVEGHVKKLLTKVEIDHHVSERLNFVAK